MNEHENVRDEEIPVVPGPLMNVRIQLAAQLYADMARHGHPSETAMKQAFVLADKFIAYHHAVPPNLPELELAATKWREEEQVKARQKQLGK